MQPHRRLISHQAHAKLDSPLPLSSLPILRKEAKGGLTADLAIWTLDCMGKKSRHVHMGVIILIADYPYTFGRASSGPKTNPISIGVITVYRMEQSH